MKKKHLHGKLSLKIKDLSALDSNIQGQIAGGTGSVLECSGRPGTVCGCAPSAQDTCTQYGTIDVCIVCAPSQGWDTCQVCLPTEAFTCTVELDPRVACLHSVQEGAKGCI